MGRAESSRGLAPPAIRKDIRAKQARYIINKTIPSILASNSRARRGAEGSELIVNPKPALPESNTGRKEFEGGEDVAYIKRKGQGRRKAKDRRDEETIVRVGYEKDSGSRGKAKGKRSKDSVDDELSNLSLRSPSSIPIPKPGQKIRIVTTDTLTATHILTFPAKYCSTSTMEKASKSGKKALNVCILNMASPLRPGGGVLSGATSQEEFLCARTTLLPSLKETFYRLPEIGGIYTHDVLVFRNSGSLSESRGELGPGERYWVDVISAGMLRFPELEGEEDEAKRLGKKDWETVEAKMRAVLRIATSKGAKKIVLGAWGCGAYGNPVDDVARAWRKVLHSEAGVAGKKSKASAEVETWDKLDEVIFAITNPKMAQDFARAFDNKIGVEQGPDREADDEDEEEEDEIAEELKAKIQEMESQLSKVWFPDLKARMSVILEGLKTQLREREGRINGDAEGEDTIDSDDAGSSADDDEDDKTDGEQRAVTLDASDEEEGENDGSESEEELHESGGLKLSDT